MFVILWKMQTGQTWWERQRDPPKWWEVEVPKPNMRDVSSVEDLVDSLLNAGDKLVIVGFYSPACLGCKYLHPKVNYSILLHKFLSITNWIDR